MAIDLNSADARIIRSFIPINTLSGSSFDELCAKQTALHADDGETLIAEGALDTDYFFLLEGEILLKAGSTEVDTVSAGSDVARFAIAHNVPRKVTIFAKGAVRYLKVDSNLFSSQAVSQHLQHSDLLTAESELVDEDAIAFLLKSSIFRQLPVSALPDVSACLQKKHMTANQNIMTQGEASHTFYILREGSCKVTHRPFENAKEIQLNDLNTGDTFGEYALLVDGLADTTINTITDCELYAVDDQQFQKWIQQPLVESISWNTASQSGDIFIDIQELDDYRHSHINGSINIPFSKFRVRLHQLSNTDRYIIVCPDGKLSLAAAFILLQQQFSCKVLSNGLVSVPEAYLDHIMSADSAELEHEDADHHNLSAMPATHENKTQLPSEQPAIHVEKEPSHISAEHAFTDVNQFVKPESNNEPVANLEPAIEQTNTPSELHPVELDAEYDVAAANIIPVAETAEQPEQVKKLDKKLQEVWKAYKKSRSQLQRSKRKYSVCQHEYKKLEQKYQHLLLQPAAGEEPLIDQTVGTEEVQSLRLDEFNKTIKENHKLKQQIIELQKKIQASKKSEKPTPTKVEEDLIQETKVADTDQSLLQQIETLETTITALEEKKNHQHQRARKYTHENKKLRQLIKELASQAIDDEAHETIMSTISEQHAFSDESESINLELLARKQQLSKKKIEKTEFDSRSFESESSNTAESKGFKKTKLSWIFAAWGVLGVVILIALLLNTTFGKQLVHQIFG